MAELAMLADIQRMVYPEEVTHQLHVMAQSRESSSVIDQCSNHCDQPPTNRKLLMVQVWMLRRLLLMLVVNCCTTLMMVDV